jgi:hypothetical protein
MRPRRGRRHRQPLPLEGEVLGPELEPEPTPRIRVEVVHRYQPRRQHNAPPPWVIALLIIAAVMWISPFGALVAVVMLSVFVTAHPAIGIALLATPVLVIIIAIHQRRRGHPF